MTCYTGDGGFSQVGVSFHWVMFGAYQSGFCLPSEQEFYEGNKAASGAVS